ncbi:hypothetical protein JL722_10045 [Aureococcus anophagefferens]|nr:hypothetical protein JL722_10045 [Aureococcus anophagefferens]
MVRGARAAALCVAAAAAARWCAFVLAPLPVGEPARPLDDGAYDLVDVAAPSPRAGGSESSRASSAPTLYPALARFLLNANGVDRVRSLARAVPERVPSRPLPLVRLGAAEYGGRSRGGLVARARAPRRRCSTGSAVAVAAGLLPVAVGFDGGGSVRVPAALTGLYGLAAGFARVPFRTEAPCSMTHAGPFATTARDAELASLAHSMTLSSEMAFMHDAEFAADGDPPLEDSTRVALAMGRSRAPALDAVVSPTTPIVAPPLSAAAAAAGESDTALTVKLIKFVFLASARPARVDPRGATSPPARPPRPTEPSVPVESPGLPVGLLLTAPWWRESALLGLAKSMPEVDARAASSRASSTRLAP